MNLGSSSMIQRRNVILHSQQVRESRPIKVRTSKSKLCRSLFSTGIIHREFFGEGSIVTDRCIRRKCFRIGFWNECGVGGPTCWKSVAIARQKAPSHKSIVVQWFLTERQIVCIDRLPYSPDSLPSDHSLFPKLKLKTLGQRHELVEKIEKAVTVKLNSIETEAFQNTFTDLFCRSQYYVELRGDYVKA